VGAGPSPTSTPASSRDRPPGEPTSALHDETLRLRSAPALDGVDLTVAAGTVLQVLLTRAAGPYDVLQHDVPMLTTMDTTERDEHDDRDETATAPAEREPYEAPQITQVATVYSGTQLGGSL
jgi:hypothetical protein